MLEEKGGWFVVNVKDARRYEREAFGQHIEFEDPEHRFQEMGMRIYVLEPGKPNCRYHRESKQEAFLVLSGECLLLVNGEEKPLKTWDFFHCPAGVSHVFVGAGDGPCAILCIGARSADHELFYPKSELARKHNAETPEPTPDPKVAYADVTKWREIPSSMWPLGQSDQVP